MTQDLNTDINEVRFSGKLEKDPIFMDHSGLESCILSILSGNSKHSYTVFGAQTFDKSLIQTCRNLSAGDKVLVIGEIKSFRKARQNYIQHIIAMNELHVLEHSSENFLNSLSWGEQ